LFFLVALPLWTIGVPMEDLCIQSFPYELWSFLSSFSLSVYCLLYGCFVDSSICSSLVSLAFFFFLVPQIILSPFLALPSSVHSVDDWYGTLCGDLTVDLPFFNQFS